MEVSKFNDRVINDKVFKIYDRQLKQRIIDSYNKKGYKLYYYKDFNLIEITNVRNSLGKTLNSPWGKAWDTWGDIVFFLDDSEYETSMKVINKSKELYDAQIDQAKLIKKMPMSHIYHNVLKLK